MAKKKADFVLLDVLNIYLLVRCENKKQMLKVKENIHAQLVGNNDYIESRIILNDSHDIKAVNHSNSVFEEGYCVYVWGFDGVKLPPLKIKVPKTKKNKKKGAKKKK